MGERPVVRVPHAPVQSHPQPAGALPHEPRLRAHREVVCEALREGREAHQQEVRPAPCWVVILCFLKVFLGFTFFTFTSDHVPSISIDGTGCISYSGRLLKWGHIAFGHFHATLGVYNLY